MSRHLVSPRGDELHELRSLKRRKKMSLYLLFTTVFRGSQVVQFHPLFITTSYFPEYSKHKQTTRKHPGRQRVFNFQKHVALLSLVCAAKLNGDVVWIFLVSVKWPNLQISLK